MSAAALAYAAFRLPESLSQAARDTAKATPRRSRLAQLVDAVTMRQLGVLVALMFLTPFVFSGVETTFALWSQSAFAWGPRENGYAYSFMGLIAVVVQGGSIGPLTRIVGERGLVIAGPVLVGAGMLVLPLSGGIGRSRLSLFLIVAGVCVTTPSAQQPGLAPGGRARARRPAGHRPGRGRARPHRRAGLWRLRFAAYRPRLALFHRGRR